MNTSARGLRLCSLSQSSSRHRQCPLTTTRKGKACWCTLASQIHETASMHKEKDKKTAGGVEVQFLYSDRRQLVL
ncbi:hypothetical protein FOXYSP1_20592 [Fusarium oxysporum f. sp. phaseoli]